MQLSAQFKQKLFLMLVGLGLGVLALHRPASPVLAQSLEELSLTAIPTRLGDDGQLHAKPGEKIQTLVKVQNSSNQDMTVVTRAQDFTLDSDGASPLPIEGEVSNRWSLASWVVLTPSEQVVSAHQTRGVNVVVEIPEDALPGGHYAMITHRPVFGDLESLATGETVDSGITQKVGTLLYVIVDGPISEDAFVRNLTFPKLTEYGPIDFTFSIESMSDVHIRPQITVELKDWLGRRVDVVQIETKNIFPLSSRDFEGRWNRIWGFGRYTAQLTASYGQSGRLAVATTHFWFFPVTLMIVALIIFLTLVAVFIAVRRHILHRRDDRSSTIATLEKKIQDLESKTDQPSPGSPPPGRGR